MSDSLCMDTVFISPISYATGIATDDHHNENEDIDNNVNVMVTSANSLDDKHGI